MGSVVQDIVIAVISGGIGGAATLLAYAHGYLRLERLEARKRRVQVAYDVLAYRYVLQSGVEQDEAPRHGFNHAFNQIPIVFGDFPNVLSAFDAYSQSQVDEDLRGLLRELVKVSGVKGVALDSHLMRVFTVKGRRK